MCWPRVPETSPRRSGEFRVGTGASPVGRGAEKLAKREHWVEKDKKGMPAHLIAGWCLVWYPIREKGEPAAMAVNAADGSNCCASERIERRGRYGEVLWRRDRTLVRLCWPRVPCLRTAGATRRRQGAARSVVSEPALSASE